MVRGNPRSEYESATNTLDTDVENGKVSESDAKAIKRLCRAFDPEDARESLPRGMYEKRKTSHKQYGTLAGWVERLRWTAHHVELTAEATDSDDINEFTTELKKAKDDDGGSRYSTSHVRNVENAAKKFYRFHDLGVNPDDIVVHEYSNGDSNGWTERDLLDSEERKALRTVANNARDKAILHMLLYAGMRNTALRTIRVRDIELENHRWYFNTSADGLKDIASPTEPRPLLQAERAVREWLENHPDPKPDNYLITGRPGYTDIDATEPVTRETIRRSMQNLKKKTAERDDVKTVKKPCHPHMLRHNFVTAKRKNPDITDAQIKFFLGHEEDSSVMESTYSHLSADDYNASAMRALGVAGAGDDSDALDPWDMTCERCDRVIAPDEEVCAECQRERDTTPWDDPKAATTQISDGIRALAAYRWEDTDGNPESTEEVADSVVDDLAMDVIDKTLQKAGSIARHDDGTPVTAEEWDEMREQVGDGD